MKNYIDANEKYVGSTVVYVGYDANDNNKLYAFKDLDCTKPFTAVELAHAYKTTKLLIALPIEDIPFEYGSSYVEPCLAFSYAIPEFAADSPVLVYRSELTDDKDSYVELSTITMEVYGNCTLESEITPITDGFIDNITKTTRLQVEFS